MDFEVIVRGKSLKVLVQVFILKDVAGNGLENSVPGWCWSLLANEITRYAIRIIFEVFPGLCGFCSSASNKSSNSDVGTRGDWNALNFWD